MIIDFYINYQQSPTSIPISVIATDSANHQIYSYSFDLNNQINHVNINTELATLAPQTITVKFTTPYINIVHYPIEITNIVLDQYFSLNSILYTGHAYFDQQFLKYAQDKNFYLDQNITDANRLDFTGHLVYKFSWPFYKNVWKNFRNLRT